MPRIILVLLLVVNPVFSIKERSLKKNLKLKKLNGNNGIKFHGASTSDEAGYAVSNAGDVNGDGYDDLLIGAKSASPTGIYAAGETYLVFGGSHVSSNGNFHLADLDGSNGFVINGNEDYDYSGYSVSGAGDVNGDGYDDVIIGAYQASSNAGNSYLIFGGSSVGSTGSIGVSDLDGTVGFTIIGPYSNAYTGRSVSGAGDFNNDGYDDILIGSDTVGTYLIFGGSSVGSSGVIKLSVLSSTTGFKIQGSSGDDSGHSVSDAGDFNGDGYADIIIGAYTGSPNANGFAGTSYILYGGATVGSSGTIHLTSLTGSDGFVMNGKDAYDYSGCSVSGAGDFNGDGFDDVIIGAYGADTSTGESYIVYGGSSVATSGSLNLGDLDGVSGFEMVGVKDFDYSGNSVSNAGDVNGDGYDDVIIGAYQAEPTTYYSYSEGESYVVLGGSAVATSGSFQLSDMDGIDGFRIVGQDEYDYSGFAVSGSGDFNGDGYADVIVGAYGSSPGKAYVVFSTKTDSSSSKLSPEEIVEIVVGSILFVIILITLMIWACCTKCKCCKSKRPQDDLQVQYASASYTSGASSYTSPLIVTSAEEVVVVTDNTDSKVAQNLV